MMKSKVIREKELSNVKVGVTVSFRIIVKIKLNVKGKSKKISIMATNSCHIVGSDSCAKAYN